LLPLLGLANHKIKLGAIGRERTWDILDQKVKHSLPKIWVHVASLGEYEQVVPVLERINREEYQVILTFFSPSGYENKKDTQLADTVCYLPLDTKVNAAKFLDLVEPSLAIMVKYEFWPNYLEELKKRDIHTVLVSGIFRENSVFTKWYGSWMKDHLQTINHFFLQNLAYVGGAMGTKGLHNILEAATYGVPVIIGKNYEKFPEAGKLEDLGGLFSVENAQEFESITNQLLADDYLHDKTGMICGHWINSNTGATRIVLDHLKQMDENMVID